MDEFEKRTTIKAAIDNLCNIVTAFAPNTLLAGGKEKPVSDELVQRYAKRWSDMAYNFIDNAETLGTGYADYTIQQIGLKVRAKPETTS